MNNCNNTKCKYYIAIFHRIDTIYFAWSACCSIDNYFIAFDEYEKNILMQYTKSNLIIYYNDDMICKYFKNI